MAADEPIDLAYAWVDDTWPGFVESLRAHARTPHDVDPGRTRDNLQLLRYSLRSVARYAPWIRRIHILTCRPQVPSWLDTSHPKIRMTHHDEIIDAANLPTFSSFAIALHLHLLPGISDRFLNMNDDMLLGAPIGIPDFLDTEGRLRVFCQLRSTFVRPRHQGPNYSPWNAAVSRSNELLDRRFGPARPRIVNHVPRVIDRALWSEMLVEWPDAVRETRQSRFRSAGNIAPYYLYLHYALATGRAIPTSVWRTTRECLYFPLQNRLFQQRLQRAAKTVLQPKFITMNDNFGARPRARVVRYIQALLDRWYPDPSPFETR